MKPKLTLLSVALSSALFPAYADTQVEDIERITVKGEFNPVTVEKLSTSVSLLNEEELAKRNAIHLEDALNSVANVNFSSGASRAKFFQIRGVGLRSQFVDPINPSVGIVVDGINYSGLGAAANLFDIEQVEVYRGPQGTRFGSDALAGMIYMESATPTDYQSGQVVLGSGNYNSRQIGAAYSNGITDNSAVNISLNSNKSDGYIENTFLNRDDTNNIDELVGRAKVRVDATPDLTLGFVAHYIDIDNGYDAFSLDNNRTTLSDEPGVDQQKTNAYAFNANYTGWSRFNLYINASISDSDLVYGYDEDWSYVGIHEDGYSTTDYYSRNRDDASFEVRLSTNPSASYTNWTVGMYAQRRDVDLQRDFWNWDLWQAADFTSQYDTQNIAIYGQLAHPIGADVKVIAGLRVERNGGDYVDSNLIVEDLSDTMWGGKLAVEYQVSDLTMLYASLTRGYKAGGINGDALGKFKNSGLGNYQTVLADHISFEPETLLSAEFGVKGQSTSGDLALRFAAFYMKRDDMQLKSWINQGAAFTGYYDNATEGTNYGLEAELDYKLTKAISINTSLGWLDTEIDGFVTADGDDKTGREQAHAPGYQYSVGLNYNIREFFYLTLGVEGKDAFFFSDSHDQKSENINLINLKLAYDLGDVTVSAWARNLMDTDYAVRGFYFGNDPRDGYTSKTYTQLGEPLVYGLTLSYQF
ncbi:TonB-dependent receptor [Flocculibacter collagenilyticus]|uniref:TonB-dependent receptor n=1 Tax=Flocculibacter collagenilyticus TaxID=2744479 RepID=UPI0018F38A21|nr:TonB-dependent receptor [Flocculibacter collagenilyticus]